MKVKLINKEIPIKEMTKYWFKKYNSTKMDETHEWSLSTLVLANLKKFRRDRRSFSLSKYKNNFFEDLLNKMTLEWTHVVILNCKTKTFPANITYLQNSILGCVKSTVGTMTTIQKHCEDASVFHTR